MCVPEKNYNKTQVAYNREMIVKRNISNLDEVLLNLNKIFNLPHRNRSWSSTSLYIDDMRQDGPEPWVSCKREGTLERWQG